MKDLNAFYSELKAAGALTGAFAAAAKQNTIAEFLKANDVDATAEEFMALANSELTDTQLEAVAGGAHWQEALMSVLSAGVLCAVVAVRSAAGTGVGAGEDGILLCNDDDWHQELTPQG